MEETVIPAVISNVDPQADPEETPTTVFQGSAVVIDGSAVVIDQVAFRRKGGRPAKIWYTEIPPNMQETPWEPLPTELPRAYRAFLIYRDLGVHRSHKLAIHVIREPEEGKDEGRLVPGQLLREWHKRFIWEVRARAWDIEYLRHQSHMWEDRMKELRQTRWDISDILFKKALTALESIRVEELTPRDVARFIQLASELAGLTEQQPVSADDVQVFLSVLPETLREKVTGLLKEASKRIADEEQARTEE